MSAIDSLAAPLPLFIAEADLVSMLCIPSVVDTWEAPPPEAYSGGAYAAVTSRAPIITL